MWRNSPCQGMLCLVFASFSLLAFGVGEGGSRGNCLVAESVLYSSWNID